MRFRSRSLSLFPSPSPVARCRGRAPSRHNPLPPPKQEPDQSRTAHELWLVLHLSRFMLDSLGGSIKALRSRPTPARAAGRRFPAKLAAGSQGIAVVDLQHGGKVVCACDATAAAAGIAPGMGLNSALALLPGLQVLARDERRERELLQALAEWAVRFTPRVSLEPPDAVLLEVRGSLRLFGGARRLIAQLRAGLQAAGLEPCLALTPTPLASLWLARSGKEVALRRPEALASELAPLPLACTRWPERSLESLATMGVRTIGDCLRLPRDGFARRFEPRMLAMLDRAVGRLPDPRESFRARERFSTGRDLEPEITDTTRLCNALEPLLGELCGFLRGRRCGIQSLELRLVHREAEPTRVPLRLTRPTGEFAHLAGLVNERLAQLQLAEPVRAMRLRAGVPIPLAEESEDLLAMNRGRAVAGVPQLIERLRARLGTEAVFGLSLVPEHRPELAWRVAEPALPAAKTRNRDRHPKPKCAPASAEGKPLWLLAEPQLLDGDDQPYFEGMLELEEGPERIESGWWDGRDVRRDYYVARNPAGVRLWVFRDREPSGRWFLHGVFG